mmetsp:Transcript_23084/g.92367  ORF Transcript_23084/g.92367 Transcript_23084/m.92367 type:complete len:298 (+) Transcript_23084:317-1210(+)
MAWIGFCAPLPEWKQTSSQRASGLARCSISGQDGLDWNRRVLLKSTGLLPFVALPGVSFGGEITEQTIVGKIETEGWSRTNNYRLNSEDVFYPEWMAGIWSSASTLTGVQSPAGETVFGPPGSLDNARKGIGNSIEYDVRFRRKAGNIVSDRPYNVTQISRAIMGKDSVLSVVDNYANVNRLRLELLPSASGGISFIVDIRVLGRQVEPSLDGKSFCCSELINQTVTPVVDGPSRSPPLIKDVETLTCYRYVSDDHLVASQKNSVFFPRGDPKSNAVKGRPIDVRTYQIEYNKIRGL